LLLIGDATDTDIPQIHRHIDTQSHRHPDTKTHGHIDTQTHRYIDTDADIQIDTETHINLQLVGDATDPDVPQTFIQTYTNTDT